MALHRQGPAARPLAAVPALLLLAALAVVRPAAAQITTLEKAPEVIETQEPLPGIMFGITGTGTFNTYAMDDVNKSVEIMNRGITQPGVKFTEFSKGASLGGGIRAILKGRLAVEATWERLIADEQIGGAVAKNDLRVPAHAYLFTVGWDMMKKRNAAFGPAVGVGYYDAKGEQIITEALVDQDPRTVGRMDLTGNTLGMHAGAYFEAMLSGRMWVNAFVGYRSAKLNGVDISGFKDLSAEFDSTAQRLPETRAIATPIAACAECQDADGNGYPEDVPDDAVIRLRNGGDTIDWSGFMGKMALTWYFNAPE